MHQIKSFLLEKKPEETYPLNLSVSKVKTFEKCKSKFKFSYIERLPKKDWEHLVFGKFLHEILELFYKKRIEGVSDLDNILLSKCWKLAFVNWKDKLTKKNIDEAKEICNFFLQDSYNNKPNVISVEEEFNINIDNKILLIGFIDRVQMDKDGTLHVADYKTSKNKKYQKEDFFQLLTYCFVMCLKNPNLKKVRASYIMLRHKLEMITWTWSRDEILAIEDKYLEFAEEIQNEKLFRPSPSPLCNYCDYIDVCKPPSFYRAGGKSQDLSYGDDKW